MQPKDENGPCSFAFGCVQDFCNMNSNSRMNAGPFQNHISSVILEDVGKWRYFDENSACWDLCKSWVYTHNYDNIDDDGNDDDDELMTNWTI